MDDSVFISGLELSCVIGTHQWERDIRQTVRLDLEVETSCRAAGRRDDLGLALDYGALAGLATELVEGSSFLLLEALAEALAVAVLERFSGARSVMVRIAKPGAVAGARCAGVTIRRRREEAGHG